MPTPILLITDPDRVAELGQERAPDHWAWHDQILPRLVADPDLQMTLDQILGEITAAIDCTECGRCCRSLGPSVDQVETARLAGALNLSLSEFRGRFLRPMWPGAAADEQTWLLPDPCPFHDGLLCTVYEHRPGICRHFPQAVGDTPADRLTQLVEFARLCPITYNTVERMMQIAAG